MLKRKIKRGEGLGPGKKGHGQRCARKDNLKGTGNTVSAKYSFTKQNK